MPLFKIGFLPIGFWDIVDILIVGFLIYQLYRLLRGSIAFNIFIGVVTLYVVWLIVDALGMDLLKAFLGQFVSVGVLILIIIFQPEVRRFLLYLGNTTLRQRSNFFDKFIFKNLKKRDDEKTKLMVHQLVSAAMKLASQKIGALVVFADNANLDGIISGGIELDAQVSQALIESIFNKESPLHDGAAIFSHGKIKAASCVLPVTDKTDLPEYLGLRHRAAVGITEKTNVAVLVVSEENGEISFAEEGIIHSHLDQQLLTDFISRWVS